MTEFTIEIAGVPVGVSARHERLEHFFRSYLSGGAPAFTVSATAEDLALERQRSDREALREGHPPRRHSDAYLESLALQRKIAEGLMAHDVLLFHGSAIAVDGQCYLFTARSGTGKSTHTRLWRERFGDRAVMVNDDKPMLRITPAGVEVCGTPWNGKHRLGTNIRLPLRAVCVLERGAENRIRPITPREALPVLLQQSQRPADPANMGKYMELVDGLAGSAAFYRLQCNMEPQAVDVSYEAMSGAGKEE